MTMNSTISELMQDNSNVTPETNPVASVQSNELIFGQKHNDIDCALCPTAKRACDRAWVTAKQVENWSKMSTTTLWRWLGKLEKARRIQSFSDMKKIKIDDENGRGHETTLYNLNVLNQLAMVCIDNEKLNDVSCKFSDILSEVETTGRFGMTQISRKDQLFLTIIHAESEDDRVSALTELNEINKQEVKALTAERDEAIRKRAEIGSRREATAMATASSARAHQRFAEKMLETSACELVTLRAVVDERRSQLWDANRTAHAIYRLNVLKKDYSLSTLENKARELLSHFALKLNKDPIPLPNGSTYTDSFGRLQVSMSTYYEKDVVDAVLDWVVKNTNKFAHVGGKRDPLLDEW